MRLLVSVANAVEAIAALAGGADVIDAKNPLTGALGAVPVHVLREIRTAVGDAAPVTAAIGDAFDDADVERLAHSFAATGPTLLKVGFADARSMSRISALLEAATSGAASASEGRCGIVAVGYADADPERSVTLHQLTQAAASAGAWGVLLDTMDKSGPGVCRLLTRQALARWIGDAHGSGLVVAVAGKLTAQDLPQVRDAGADIAGVRSAACENGRTGQLSADRVRLLRSTYAPASGVRVQAH